MKTYGVNRFQMAFRLFDDRLLTIVAKHTCRRCLFEHEILQKKKFLHSQYRLIVWLFAWTNIGKFSRDDFDKSSQHMELGTLLQIYILNFLKITNVHELGSVRDGQQLLEGRNRKQLNVCETRGVKHEKKRRHAI